MRISQLRRQQELTKERASSSNEKSVLNEKLSENGSFKISSGKICQEKNGDLSKLKFVPSSDPLTNFIMMRKGTLTTTKEDDSQNHSPEASASMLYI